MRELHRARMDDGAVRRDQADAGAGERRLRGEAGDERTGVRAVAKRRNGLRTFIR